MFQENLNKGKIGEDAVAAYLTNCRNHTITDVRDQNEYRKRDIDFIVSSASGDQSCLLEVKSDKKIGETLNLCIEESNERETGNYKGWYHYCEADYICFYDWQGGTGYIIDWKKAKPQLKDLAQLSVFPNRFDGGFSWCYLLSIGKAKKSGLIKHTFNYKMGV